MLCFRHYNMYVVLSDFFYTICTSDVHLYICTFDVMSPHSLLILLCKRTTGSLATMRLAACFIDRFDYGCICQEGLQEGHSLYTS